MRQLVIAVVITMLGCAGARIETPGGMVYSAWAIGQGHASAGRCDRVASDESSATKDTETRITREDERGQLCAVASGGRGSPGAWAAIAGGLAALATLVAGAL